MKRVMTAALALSLLGGTSAFAQQADGRGRGDHDRREARQERRDDRQDRRQDRREDRQEQRGERQDRREGRRDDRQDRRPPVVQAPPQRGSPSNPAVAESLRRQQAQARARAEHRGQRGDDRRNDDRRGNDQRRDDRPQWNGDRNRDGRPDWNRDRDRRGNDYRGNDRNDHRGGWERNYRPGAGHGVRDRDRGRQWYNSNQWRRSYHAPRRYRAPSYRYPSGWYVRSWTFGDILPRAWFGSSYYLDWRYYGLPVPPIGTEWVRVRDDALLVDVWTGRVLTVYYDLFW